MQMIWRADAQDVLTGKGAERHGVQGLLQLCQPAFAGLVQGGPKVACSSAMQFKPGSSRRRRRRTRTVAGGRCEARLLALQRLVVQALAGCHTAMERRAETAAPVGRLAAAQSHRHHTIPCP